MLKSFHRYCYNFGLSTFVPLLLLIGTLGTAQAEMKIGTVDMNRVFSEYFKTKEAQAKYAASESEIQKELDTRTDVLKKQMEEINALTSEVEKATLSKEALDTKRKECEEKINKARALDRDIVEFRSAKQKKLQDEFLAMRQGIVDEIMKVVNEQTKVRGFDIVLDKSGLSAGSVPVVLFSRPDLDVSNEVLTVLNKKASSK